MCCGSVFICREFLVNDSLLSLKTFKSVIVDWLSFFITHCLFFKAPSVKCIFSFSKHVTATVFRSFLGMIHIWRPWKISTFWDPPPLPLLFIYVQTYYTPLTLDVQSQTNPLSSPNDNQSINRKHNLRMTIIFDHVLPSDWFSFSVSTHWSYLAFLWLLFIKVKPHYLLFRDFILFCVQLLKNITKYILFIIIHIFSTHFAIRLLYLHNLKT